MTIVSILEQRNEIPAPDASTFLDAMLDVSWEWDTSLFNVGNNAYS